MSDTKWSAEKIEQKQLAQLIPYDRNPKAHPDSQIDKLANSIREWGFTIPILVDEDDMVLAGHGRLFAAQRLGMTEVPTIKAVGWSDQQKKAYIIADNKLAEKGEWDTPMLYAELKQISQSGFDLSLMGAEDDFELMDFSPNTDPTMDFSSISSDDMNRASDGLEQSFSERNVDASIRSQEVICPHCSKSFRFEGI